MNDPEGFGPPSPQISIQGASEIEAHRIRTAGRLYAEQFPIEASRLSQQETLVVVTRSIDEELRARSTREDLDLLEACGRAHDYYGWTLPPSGRNSRFTILVSKRSLASAEYQRVLPHELTHVSDYSFFLARVGNVWEASEEDRCTTRFWAYWLWSEFHSKTVGLKVWYGLRIREAAPRGGAVRIDVQTQADVLRDSLDAFLTSRAGARDLAIQRFRSFMYSYAQYLGRLKVLRDLSGDDVTDPDFPLETLRDTFGAAVFRLPEILEGMPTSGDAFRRLGHLDSEIQKTIRHSLGT